MDRADREALATHRADGDALESVEVAAARPSGPWATVANEQSLVEVVSEHVESLVDYVLRAEGVNEGGVEVAFVDDPTISRLHEQFLDITGPTDVITFPLLDPDDPQGSLGEVVVSTETARRQCRSYGLDPRDETLLYVVHGVLHLLGYDDHDIDEQAEMTERQLQLLSEWKQTHG